MPSARSLQIANAAADRICAGKIEQGNQHFEIQNIVLGTEQRSGILARDRNIFSRGVQQCFESCRRISAHQRQLAQNQVGAGSIAGIHHLHVESRFVQIERNALRRQLHGSVAFCCERERWRREPSAQLIRLVQVAIGREKKRVPGESLRQKAGADLTLLLKDHIEERAAVDGLRNGRAQNRARQRAGVRGLQRQQFDRRRHHHREPLLLRLAQLLRRDLGNVCAAHAQVEPLVANRPVGIDRNLVEERPPLPAIRRWR